MRSNRGLLCWIALCAGIIAALGVRRADWASVWAAGSLAALTTTVLLFGPRLRRALQLRLLRGFLRRRPPGAWPLPHVYSEHGREVLEAADRDPALRAEVTEQVERIASDFARRLRRCQDRGPLADHYRLLGYLERRATGTRDAATDPGVSFGAWTGSYSLTRVRLAALCQLAIREGALQPVSGEVLYR